MTNKSYIILFFFLTVSCGSFSAFFFTRGVFFLAILSLVITISLFCHILSYIFKILRDVDDFTEAVRYRDFSRKYPKNKSRKSHFYQGFNAITETFLSLSQEKEAQYYYLKKMLELVDAGILSYDTETNETLWMNDALKNMFNIPYLGNINWLQKRNKKLYDELMNIPLGESRLASIDSGKQVIKTLTNASTFQTEGKTYKLVAFHNISATLEEVEAGAWKGLLNVMTHEIMNSIAPVSSLSDTLKKRMENIKQEMSGKLHPDFEDIEFALDTIYRRSEGLLRFADSYRSLSKTIVLNLQQTNLFELLNSIYRLMNPSLDQKGILLKLETDNLSVVANVDRSLIEQVLINFITNAMHAVKDRTEPHIILFSGITAEDSAYITVADNGCGISPENRDKIFIPFFSTKKNGSGIGLSLSREIVKLHKGNIKIQSVEGEGSAFTILFD
ncbi:MAG: GHKL domain-containing protein [Dysgonamonadaceae bacterium]|jgi:nitrogen fixation/metabolism regulation signal transduction histidine kinase|nr:GHKL domain-containing protein [Dysgonamonadaceae bacterium]